MIKDNSAIADMLSGGSRAPEAGRANRATGKTGKTGKTRSGGYRAFESFVPAARASSGSAVTEGMKARKRHAQPANSRKRQSDGAPAAGLAVETARPAGGNTKEATASGGARIHGPAGRRPPVDASPPGASRESATGQAGRGAKAPGSPTAVVSAPGKPDRATDAAAARIAIGPSDTVKNVTNVSGRARGGAAPGRIPPWVEKPRGHRGVAAASAGRGTVRAVTAPAGGNAGGPTPPAASPATGAVRKAATPAAAGAHAGRGKPAAARAGSRPSSTRSGEAQRPGMAAAGAAGGAEETRPGGVQETRSGAPESWTVTTREFAGETAVRISMMLRGNQGPERMKARIRLEPEALGQVEVDLEVGKGLKVKLTAHHEAGFTAIKQELGQLRAALETRGLALEDLKLDLAPGDTGGGQGAGRETPGHRRNVTIRAAIERLTPAAGGIALAPGGGGMLNIVV